MKTLRALIFGVLLPLAGVGGCADRHTLVSEKPAIVYDGPTDALDVVLAKINSNNARIATVTASGTFEASLGREHKFLNGGVILLHSKPDKLRLELTKPGMSGPLMFAGTNGTHWWLSVAGDIDTTYFGTQKGIANTDPRLPISPELIGDVLGVATLNLDMRAEPVPTLRFNPSYDAYMLTWSVATADRWVTLREVWYDRQTLRPERVWLFDRDGRVTVKAILSDFAPMNVSTGDSAAAPRVSRTYDLTFPGNESHMTFRFDEVRATRGKAPNAKTYLFDQNHVSTSKVENLDDVDAAK